MDADIDAAALIYVLENLQSATAESGGGPCDLESLARHCNVLWEYQCNPDSFRSLWEDAKPKSSSSSTSGNQRGHVEEPAEFPRCWRAKSSRRSTPVLLANIALVLGLEEVFKEEISVAVWCSKAESKTSVPKLCSLPGTTPS